MYPYNLRIIGSFKKLKGIWNSWVLMVREMGYFFVSKRVRPQL